MLLTKIYKPSPNDNLVHRSNLFEKLDQGLSKKLVLVSAPAGFGKTTLVCDWIDKNGTATAWYSIDKADNDIDTFLTYVISAIQLIRKDFGLTAINLIKSGNQGSYESIINLLINDSLEIKDDILIVFDDFHLIENKEITSLILYFIEHIPNHVHVVFITRSDPNFPIARLRSQGQLVELRASDLSFSSNDISILFNKKLKISLSIEDVQSLEVKTEGWIAGLQLTALSIHGKDDVSSFIKALKGDNRYIMDYLMEEVLKIQSDEVRDFLLKTSFLKQISAPLCNYILNRSDSQIVIEELERNNMFVIPLDSERKNFRYHHLFADLLKQRLLLHDSDILNILHAKASEWFENNGVYELAIEHALAAQDFSKSIEILGLVVEELWADGRHSAILNYGEILPDKYIKKDRVFCLYYAWILISAGRIQVAEPFLTEARRLTEGLLNGQEITKVQEDINKKLLGKIYVALAYLQSFKEHSNEIFDICKKAMEYMTKDDPFWYSWSWFSYGIACYSSGKLDDSSTAFHRAFEYAKGSGNIYLISTIAIRMAENELELGNYKPAYERCTNLLKIISDKGYSEIVKSEWSYSGLYSIMANAMFAWADTEKALEYSKIAHELGKGSNDIYVNSGALMLYGMILIESGDISGGERMLDQVEELLKHGDLPPYFKYSYLGCKLYVLVETEKFEQAENFIEMHGINDKKDISFSNETIYMMYVRLLLEQGHLKKAAELLFELEKIIVAGKRIERLIELKMSYSILSYKKNEQDDAIGYMIEVIELAADQSLVGYLTINLSRIHHILKPAIKQISITNTNISSDFINSLRIAIQKKEKSRKKQNDGGLSAREKDTLVLIAENFSNQEIADKLFVSINTVKTHVKNILIKLDVKNRIQANKKAKELGII